MIIHNLWGVENVYVIKQGYKMKKVLLFVIFGLVGTFNAFADVNFSETETITTWENVTVVSDAGPVRYRSSRDVVAPRPCMRATSNQPVRIKTHSEVVDYYQVYQPVTVYQPMGVQVERRFVPAHRCNKCAF